MIINTGMRTDIPAFYSEWFANRLRAGFVLVRNPYNPHSVTRYRLSPDVVDLIQFNRMPHSDMEFPDSETIRVWKPGSLEPDINTFP